MEGTLYVFLSRMVFFYLLTTGWIFSINYYVRIQSKYPCMTINVSVQYCGGLLPDNMLLALCYYNCGTQLHPMKSFCPYSLCSHLPGRRFDFALPDWVDAQKV